MDGANWLKWFVSQYNGSIESCFNVGIVSQYNDLNRVMLLGIVSQCNGSQ